MTTQQSHLYHTLGNMSELDNIKFCRLPDVKENFRFVCECPIALKGLLEKSMDKREHFNIWKLTLNRKLSLVTRKKEKERKRIKKKVVALQQRSIS